MINLDAFTNAVDSLELAIKRYNDPANCALLDAMRDSVVKRFEYTYELSLKTIRRHLNYLSIHDNDELINMSFQNFIRTALQKDLIKSDLTIWKTYREARNITSHNYNEAKAEKVVSVAILFLEEAKYIINAIQRDLNYEN